MTPFAAAGPKAPVFHEALAGHFGCAVDALAAEALQHPWAGPWSRR